MVPWFKPTASAIPDSGVSRWTHDDADTSGSTALDVWGDNDGTITGATTGVSGELKEAYSFDGVDDYVEYSGTAGIDFSGAFSISIWLYHNFGASTGFDRIFSKATGDSGAGQEWIVQQNGTDDEVAFGYNYGNSIVGGNVAPISPQSWVHIVVTRESDGSLTMYQNGGQVDTDSSADASSSSAPIRAGTVGSFQSSTFYEGRIDDPRIYSKALSSTEVSNLYNTGSISG